MLSDPDPQIRIHATVALSRFGDVTGESEVLPLLKHEDAMVRQQAANVLGEIGSKDKALPALEKAYTGESHPAAKQVLQFALAQLKARLGIKEEPPAPPQEPVEKKKKATSPRSGKKQ
jgi:HEAT repeat protein